MAHSDDIPSPKDNTLLTSEDKAFCEKIHYGIHNDANACTEK